MSSGATPSPCSVIRGPSERATTKKCSPETHPGKETSPQSVRAPAPRDRRQYLVIPREAEMTHFLIFSSRIYVGFALQRGAGLVLCSDNSDFNSVLKSPSDFAAEVIDVSVVFAS